MLNDFKDLQKAVDLCGIESEKVFTHLIGDFCMKKDLVPIELDVIDVETIKEKIGNENVHSVMVGGNEYYVFETPEGVASTVPDFANECLEYIKSYRLVDLSSMLGLPRVFDKDLSDGLDYNDGLDEIGNR